MKEVIRIDRIDTPDEKPVEFTHYLDTQNGWGKTFLKPSHYDEIIYLGCCVIDGDMFAAYDEGGGINILKGHLNSGKY